MQRFLRAVKLQSPANTIAINTAMTDDGMTVQFIIIQDPYCLQRLPSCKTTHNLVTIYTEH